MRRQDDVVRSGGTNSTASPLPPGPVRMELGFTVGPVRGWMNLWKPTLDALGQILGHARPLVPGAPRRPQREPRPAMPRRSLDGQRSAHRCRGQTRPRARTEQHNQHSGDECVRDAL